MTKIVRKAKVDPWPRVFHSLRASCESDLAQSFPLAVVAKWLGNTPSVALRHYVDPTDAAFEQATGWQPRDAKNDAGATQKTTQARAATRQQEVPGVTEPLGIAGSRRLLATLEQSCPDVQRECMGIEPQRHFRIRFCLVFIGFASREAGGYTVWGSGLYLFLYLFLPPVRHPKPPRQQGRHI